MMEMKRTKKKTKTLTLNGLKNLRNKTMKINQIIQKAKESLDQK